MYFSAINMWGLRVEFQAGSFDEALEHAEWHTLTDVGQPSTVHYH